MTDGKELISHIQDLAQVLEAICTDLLQLASARVTATEPESVASGQPSQLLLSPREASKALAISERTLWSLTAPRGPIKCVRITKKCIRYSPAALQKWIEHEESQSPK